MFQFISLHLLSAAAAVRVVLRERKTKGFIDLRKRERVKPIPDLRLKQCGIAYTIEFCAVYYVYNILRQM